MRLALRNRIDGRCEVAERGGPPPPDHDSSLFSFHRTIRRLLPETGRADGDSAPALFLFCGGGAEAGSLDTKGAGHGNFVRLSILLHPIMWPAKWGPGSAGPLSLANTEAQVSEPWAVYLARKKR